jgi:hypothetical protein
VGWGVALLLSEAELEQFFCELREAGIEATSPEVRDGWRHYTLTDSTGVCELTVGGTSPAGPYLKVALVPVRHEDQVYARAAAIAEQYRLRTDERVSRHRLGWTDDRP